MLLSLVVIVYNCKIEHVILFNELWLFLISSRFHFIFILSIIIRLLLSLVFIIYNCKIKYVVILINQLLLSLVVIIYNCILEHVVILINQLLLFLISSRIRLFSYFQ